MEHLIVKNDGGTFELAAEKGEYCGDICDKLTGLYCKACPIHTAFAKLYEYESIGSPEECRAAVKKQNPIPVVEKVMLSSTGENVGRCPECLGAPLRKYDNPYCPECGQKLDWGDEE